MDKIKDFYSDYRDYILFSFCLLIFILSSLFFYYYFKSSISSLEDRIKDRPIVEVNKEVSTVEKYAVNIKGEVKKPGVYFLDKGKRVIDVVNKAGGFTKKADSFVNNLSKKITDEMVIIIYSKQEVKDFKKTKEQEKQVIDKCIQKDETSLKNNACIEENPNKNIDQNSKININTASLEELMTLPGIGESKAKSIIKYRDNTPFKTIDDLKNIQGIGDNLFAQIKENITT